MRVHSDNLRAMYKHTIRSLTYLTIIADLSNHHLEVNGREERAGCFTLLVFLVYCDCYYLWLFIMVAWVVMQCVINVFPDQIHLFFRRLQRVQIRWCLVMEDVI